MPLFDFRCPLCKGVTESYLPLHDETNRIECASKCGSLAVRCVGRADGRAPAKRVVDVTGYHPSLARFSGDPSAYVDGKHSLQKVIDARQAAGWGRPAPADEIARAGGPKARSADADEG